MDHKSLARKAVESKKYSYSPYSKFRVGAALLAANGTIIQGCNIENSSFSLTICAERTAIFKAISDGLKKFSALAIASDSNDFITPCGACRQVIHDIMPGIDILLVNKKGKYTITKASKLLPRPFGKEHLAL